jgi:hypothetical protein
MFSGANAPLAALLAWLLSTSPACAGDSMDGVQDHGHHSSEFVLFLSAEAHHFTAPESGSELNEDANVIGDALLAIDRDRFRLLGEFQLSREEHDLERFQVGFEPIADTVVWLGRFHQPGSAWNTEHHHGRYLQTSVTRHSRDAGVPVLEWIDLEPVIHEALRLFGALIPATVGLQTDIAGPCPPVKADAALAIQLIMNICTNAYQALRGGQGVLTISLATRPAPGPAPDGSSASSDDHVVLSIADTGHGMDAGTKERIFEPFFTTREVGVGTGLGLSVVHGIAESFGASIVVDSTPDLGTTFHIFFPAGPKPSTEERVSQTHAGANT